MANQMAFINPRSGQLNGFTDPADIKSKFHQFGFDPEIRLGKTGKAMATFIARARRTKPDLVMVAGGDGTIGTILKGLVGAKIKLGLIPTGSVNNIGSRLGLTGEIDQALAVIAAGHTIGFDIAKVGRYYMAEGMGIGLIARIFDATDWDKDKKLVQMAAATAKSIVTAPHLKLRVEADGQSFRTETVWLTVTNLGGLGALTLTPRSQPNDGAMELVYCKPLTIAEMPKYIASFLKATHLGENKFVTRQVKQLHFKLPHKTTVHIDDQCYQSRSVTLKVIPGAVKVFALRS